jgi:hypothetical protein
MKILPPSRKSCLAALLLAGCCCAVADPATTSTPAAQDPVKTQAMTPATPPDPSVPSPAQDNEPPTLVSPDEDNGHSGIAPRMDSQAPGPFEAEPETAAMNPAAAEGADVTGMEEAPDALPADVPVIDPATLHGDWIVREQHPEAGEVVTLFSINPDNSFAGTMTVAGNVVWRYSGNWYLDDNLITWFYNQSTPPLMLEDETEVDEIIAVDSEKLVYRSGKRDVLETLYRASN